MVIDGEGRRRERLRVGVGDDGDGPVSPHIDVGVIAER